MSRPMISRKVARTLLARVTPARQRYHEAVEQGNALLATAEASGCADDWERLRAAHEAADRAKADYEAALYGLYGTLQYYAGERGEA